VLDCNTGTFPELLPQHAPTFAQGLAILIAVVVVSTVVSFQNYSQQLSFESLQGTQAVFALKRNCWLWCSSCRDAPTTFSLLFTAAIPLVKCFFCAEVKDDRDVEVRRDGKDINVGTQLFWHLWLPKHCFLPADFCF
jgi:hypothetical protein